MSGNSWASALHTAPIVSDFCRFAGSPATPRRPELELELAVVAGRRLDGHQRAWNVSLYFPICTSSPSSSWCDSIRERFT